MANLENVKKWYVTTKGPRDSYARVVHTQDCPFVPLMTNAHVWTRNPFDERVTSGLYSCQRCKPTASPETIAKQKAKLQQDEADYKVREAERAREAAERQERIASLWRRLNAYGGLTLKEQSDNDNVIVFIDRGRRYRIEEVEDETLHQL